MKSRKKGSTLHSPFLKSTMKKKDASFEAPLRPLSLQEFTGQPHTAARLQILIQAAKKRNDALGHLLFFGPPGLGKTTLAQILAGEMEKKLITTSGPVIEKPADIAGILTSLQEGDCLFIDEIHRLPKTIEEYLYSAMEDFRIDLMIDSGPNARSVPIELPPFTLIGATTKSGMLSSPLRTRFHHQLRLDYYSVETLTTIAFRTAKLLGKPLDPPSALSIAKRSRGTPRVLNNLMRWLRDYADIHAGGTISQESTKEALDMLAIDEKGLDEMDKKILTVMMEHHNGGPVGINTLALAVGEESSTIAEVYEPFLVREGLIKRTPRGRELTPLAYAYLQPEKNTPASENKHHIREPKA